MLTNATVYPTLPAIDLQRAKKFYVEKLGLQVLYEDPSPGITFKTGNNCQLHLYKRGPTRADHTVATFLVEDIRAEVNELRSKGVKFEEYDIPEMNLKTVDGIASRIGDTKVAWFKDTEGNILALTQMSLSDVRMSMAQTAGTPVVR